MFKIFFKKDKTMKLVKESSLMKYQLQNKRSLVLNVESKDILRVFVIFSKRRIDSTTRRIEIQKEHTSLEKIIM